MMFPKPSRRKRDKAFIAALHDEHLPCVLRDADDDPTRGGKEQAGPCDPGIQANHAGVRPLGRKADDDTCIPMCPKHHLQWTDSGGFFSNRPHGWRRDWAEKQIEETRKRLRCQEDGVRVVALPY